MVGALCDALGYQNGTVLRQEVNNFCPEPHSITDDGQNWTTDFVQSIDWGAEYRCFTYK